MPWHAPSDLSTHGLTKEARALFSSFDKSNDRRVNVSNRRMALKAGLGLPESTSQLAAMSSRNEAVAARKVFDSFDFDQSGSIDAKELRPALELLQLHVSSDEASKLISRYDADSSAKLELGEFRSLCAKLRLYRRRQQRRWQDGIPHGERSRPRGQPRASVRSRPSDAHPRHGQGSSARSPGVP